MSWADNDASVEATGPVRKRLIEGKGTIRLSDEISEWVVHEELDSGGATYVLTLPKGMEELSLANVRVERSGGDTSADIAFRSELFAAIGSVTAGGAHVEAALKRLLLILSGIGSQFALVDKTWADLEKDLRAIPEVDNPQRKELVELLDWAEGLTLRDRRHTVVHGAWWLFDGVGARVSRWPRKQSDHVQTGTIDNLELLANQIWIYAHGLDEMLGERWPRARLPAPELPPALCCPQQLRIDVHTGYLRNRAVTRWNPRLREPEG